jgi:hypothetical protein
VGQCHRFVVTAVDLLLFPGCILDIHPLIGPDWHVASQKVVKQPVKGWMN